MSANGGQSTWLATFAPLKCKPKWIFLSTQGWDKNKGKRAVFPYDKASYRKPCLSLSFLDCAVTTSTVRQKQTAQSSLSLPNQTATKKSSQNTKKAGYLSLLLLPSFCVSLHFDLLFCKPDFETHQPYEQSH